MRALLHWLVIGLLILAAPDLTTAPAAVATAAPVAPAAVVSAPAPVEYCAIPDEAIDLIIAFEVGSPETYTRKYQRPIWPGAASGVTIGLGYDLGYHAPNVIAMDWQASPHAVRLATASGITGPLSREHSRALADILIAYDIARQVFDLTSVTEHFRLTRRAFGERAICDAPPAVRGALLSLVFNRGASMQGTKRAEMRAIRDVCLPARDWRCVADNIRAMSRHWIGTDIAAGMQRRRYAEAGLIDRAA